MSTENLDRGIGPLRLGAGRVWAEDLISRKTAGLAGWYCAVLGSMRDGPKELRSTLMSRTLLPPHFIGDLKKQKKERESERKTSRREKKWRSDYREATGSPFRLVNFTEPTWIYRDKPFHLFF